MENILYVPKSEALYNRRVKINPLNGEVLEDLCCSRDIFNPYGMEKSEPNKKSGRSIDEAAKESGSGDGKARAASRARRELFELCACNDFDMFFTLTLDKEKIDRYDYKTVVGRLSQWLDNRVRRKGLRYVAVPELHKDGAIHFHGLCNSEALKLSDSGHRDNGKSIYNVTDWKFGFTTAVYLYGDPLAASHYVAKYVTKSTAGGTIGGRYFYHGGDLKKARCFYFHEDFETFSGKEFPVEGVNITFKYAK